MPYVFVVVSTIVLIGTVLLVAAVLKAVRQRINEAGKQLPFDPHRPSSDTTGKDSR